MIGGCPLPLIILLPMIRANPIKVCKTIRFLNDASLSGHPNQAGQGEGSAAGEGHAMTLNACNI
jgi:hypothetical protein